MARFRLIIPIYYTILLLCIGVSSVLSYFGLLSNLSWLTIPAVAVIALGLFSAGLLLQVARDKKRISQQILAILLFLMFASASTSSNINAIYTDRMWQEVRNKAFEEEYGKYTDTIKTIEAELKTSTESDQAYFEKIVSFYGNNINEEITNLKVGISTSVFFQNLKDINDTLNAELNQMLVQATDPNNPGCGTKCREHMAEINTLVPTTDTVMPKGKTITDIKRNWVQYRKEKMNAFCTDASYSPFHTLRGLVDVVENDDFCKSMANYSDKYGSNKLENLRNQVNWEANYSEENVKAYLEQVASTRLVLENINGDLNTLDVEFSDLEFSIIDEYPRSLEAAAILVADRDTSFNLIDLGGIKLRAGLMNTIRDREFLAAKVVSSDGKTEQSFIFDLELSQNEVVVDRDEPIQPFFEILKNKQNDLISRYEDAFATEAKSNFILINTQNGKIGEIEQTLRSAFVVMPDKGNTIIASVMGFAFDFIPIVFAFVAFHGYVREEEGYNPVIG